jgi:poly-gamma-glutamate synthesis protein (capsule biosynthesis protein)
MKIWHKISLVGVLLVLFQLLSPVQGVSFLQFDELAVGQVDTSTEVTDNETSMTDVYFFGDMMLARDVERTMRRAGADFPFAGFSIPSTSYAVANFESAIPEIHVATPNNTFRFSTPKSSLDAVSRAGFTHLGLANNHSFDFGLAGYNQTVSAVWDAGLIPFGHPSVVALPSYTVVQVKSKTVGILAVHTLYSEPTRESLAAVIETMKSESDVQVAYVHWGEEYTDKPSARQRNFARILSGLGIDIIVGHHPHVVQSIEMVDNTLVLYSLGNFIFDQYFSPAVQQGLVLKLAFGEEAGLEIIPVSSLESRNQPREMSAQNKAIFLDYLASISGPSLRQNITEGKISLTSMLAITPEVVIMTE